MCKLEYNIVAELVAILGREFKNVLSSKNV